MNEVIYCRACGRNITNEKKVWYYCPESERIGNEVNECSPFCVECPEEKSNNTTDDFRFKAKSKIDDKWYEFSLYDIGYMNSDIFMNYKHWRHYIGINDMDGKMVYAGDILRHDYYNNETKKDEFSISIVEYGEWDYDYGGCCLGYDINGFWGCNFKIIGNIFDNPELLEGE